MTERFNINAITTKSKEWTTKVQVVDKGRPRDNLQKIAKYQLIILQDEEEAQVQCIIFGSNITRFVEQFLPFHTYLVTTASVKESSNAYGIPISNFTWTIDKDTIVEPIEEVDPSESALPPPTCLTLTMFNDFVHQAEGLEFDILAIVVNIGLPTYAANGSRIQELIIMDDHKKPTKFTLWENFIDHDGVTIMEQLDQYPIILARKVGKSKSSAGLTTRFGTTIQINPPYPQVAALRTWVISNKKLLIAYTKKTVTSTGCLQFTPFEDHIISIADAQQYPSIMTTTNFGQILCIQAEFLLLDENQFFYVLVCSTCKQVFTRLHSRRQFYCTNCRRSTNLIPRCQLEITVADSSGSATTVIADEYTEKILHLTSEEIYDIRGTKKQKLPLASVRKHLNGKTFTIHIKRSLSKSMDGTLGKFIVLSYMEKENIISAPSSPTPMDIAGSSKRKMFNQDITIASTSSDENRISKVETIAAEQDNKELGACKVEKKLFKYI